MKNIFTNSDFKQNISEWGIRNVKEIYIAEDTDEMSPYWARHKNQEQCVAAYERHQLHKKLTSDLFISQIENQQKQKI